MKAAVYDEFGPPEVLRYIDIPDPEIGAGDVLIEVEAISIEGGDLINRRTVQPPHAGHIVGYAAAGTIVSVGDHVSARRIGDRVTSFGVDGSHAALRSVPANQTWLVPDGVRWAYAAALPISFGTANHCLFRRAALKAGETVLVQAAAGGVGLAAIQLAKRAGALVIASSSDEGRLSRLAAIGADHVIDHRAGNVAEEVLGYSGGKGADVVIDPVGSTLPTSLRLLAPEGRLVFVGNAGGGLLTVDLWSAMQANQSLFGVFMGTQFAEPNVFSTVDQMLREVSEARLQVPIDRSFALENAADAHRHAEDGKPFGRVILHP